MIVTINSFEKYRAFILDISRDPLFCDPHFTYDPDNLYGSLHRKDESAFAVVTGGTRAGPVRQARERLSGNMRSPLLAEAVRRNGPNRMMALVYTDAAEEIAAYSLRPDLRKSRGRTRVRLLPALINGRPLTGAARFLQFTPAGPPGSAASGPPRPPPRRRCLAHVLVQSGGFPLLVPDHMEAGAAAGGPGRRPPRTGRRSPFAGLHVQALPGLPLVQRLIGHRHSWRGCAGHKTRLCTGPRRF